MLARRRRRRDNRCCPTAVGYLRVSREERVRERVSLGAQCGRIAAYSDAKSLQLVEVLADEGPSGKDLERLGLE